MAEPARAARLHHLALRVEDLERAAAFYGGLLGLPEARRQTEGSRLRSVWLRAGDSILMLEQRLAGRGVETGSGHLLAFAVDDLVAWEARLAAAGVALDDRTGHSLYFRDPDGHRVAVTTYPRPD